MENDQILAPDNTEVDPGLQYFEGKENLIAAIDTDDTDTIIELGNSDPDLVNNRYIYGDLEQPGYAQTPLEYAIYQANFPAVQALLATPIDLSNGGNIIQYAIRNIRDRQQMINIMINIIIILLDTFDKTDFSNLQAKAFRFDSTNNSEIDREISYLIDRYIYVKHFNWKADGRDCSGPRDDQEQKFWWLSPLKCIKLKDNPEYNV